MCTGTIASSQLMSQNRSFKPQTLCDRITIQCNARNETNNHFVNTSEHMHAIIGSTCTTGSGKLKGQARDDRQAQQPLRFARRARRSPAFSVITHKQTLTATYEMLLPAELEPWLLAAEPLPPVDPPPPPPPEPPPLPVLLTSQMLLLAGTVPQLLLG